MLTQDVVDSYHDWYYKEQDLDDELQEKVEIIQKRYNITYTDLGLSPGEFVKYFNKFNEIYHSKMWTNQRQDSNYELLYTQHNMIQHLAKQVNELKMKGKK